MMPLEPDTCIRRAGALLELAALPQWISWWSVVGRGECIRLPNGQISSKPLKVQAKPHKLPIDPRTGGYARTTDPSTWADDTQAREFSNAHALSGVGFVFSDDDPYSGIDLDDCRNPETGAIEEWAWDIVRWLDSYTEVSPSRTGVKIWVRGQLPGGRGVQRKRGSGKIEMFSRARYFTFTGSQVPETPATIESRQDALAALYAELGEGAHAATRASVGASSAAAGSATVLLCTDENLLERARHAANGAKFTRLWDGDWKAAGYPSQSEADLALCTMLAFLTGREAARMDALFRRSGLMRPNGIAGITGSAP